jgi:hypothetical protein
MINSIKNVLKHILNDKKVIFLALLFDALVSIFYFSIIDFNVENSINFFVVALFGFLLLI